MNTISKSLLLISSCISFSISSYGQTELWGTAAFGGNAGLGVVFKTNYDGSNQQIIHQFSTSYPGDSPQGELIEAANGKLYGYTFSGGSCGYGNLIEFDEINNIYFSLVDFDLNTDGGYPAGHPIQAVNGKLYGIIASGGAVNGGTIFSYDIPGQVFTVISDFNGLDFGPTNNGGFVEATNGKLYALGSGGTGGGGVLFEYDITTNTLTKFYDFPASAIDGFEPWGGLIQASNGKLYGMTAYGGTDDFGVIFEYDITTSTFTKRHDFTALEGKYSYSSLMEASNGKLYGMTNEGGTDGTLFEFDPATYLFDTKIFFDGTVGGSPWYGTVCEAPNGKLY